MLPHSLLRTGKLFGVTQISLQSLPDISSNCSRARSSPAVVPKSYSGPVVSLNGEPNLGPEKLVLLIRNPQKLPTILGNPLASSLLGKLGVVCSSVVAVSPGFNLGFPFPGPNQTCASEYPLIKASFPKKVPQIGSTNNIVQFAHSERCSLLEGPREGVGPTWNSKSDVRPRRNLRSHGFVPCLRRPLQ